MRNISNNRTINKSLRALWGLMSKKLKLQFVQLLFLVIVGGLSEVISLGAIIPFLAILINPVDASNIPFVSWAINFFNLDIINGNYGQLMIIFSMIIVIANIFRYLLIYMTNKFNYGLGHEIGIGIYKKALYESYDIHISRNKSEVISGFVKLELALWMIITTLNALSAIILSLFITFTLFIISPFYTAAILALLGVIYTLFYFISEKWLITNSDIVSLNGDTRLQSAQEGLNSIRDIILGSKQNFFLDNFINIDKEFRSAQVSTEVIAPAPRHMIEVSCILFIVFFAYISMNENGNASNFIPTIGVLVVGLQRLIPLGQQIYHGWTKYNGEKKPFNDIINLISSTLESTLVNSKELEFTKKIEFKNVFFQYKSNELNIINNVNFKIMKGSRIGLIGSTGSGKSTLVDLLVGLLIPQSGEILIDDIELTQEYLKSWREKISYVSQDIYLLDGTFLINVAFGEKIELIDEDRVKWACEKAQISNFIDEYAEGYETLIGDDGIYLSGGQKQRIAIARALYKNSSILVFDEATSALDTKTEKSIATAIDTLGPEITTISIAHRLSTIENCDWVYKINKGVIESQGSPKDML
jgi:ATP-binding cassette, subfamily B, bacterial PglK